MTKKALNALKASIEHWTRLATGTAAPHEGVGPDNCALCGLFINNTNCKGCPVAARTGKPTCAGTPYPAADALYHNYDCESGPRSKRFKQAAKKEVAFLKSLLPK